MNRFWRVPFLQRIGERHRVSARLSQSVPCSSISASCRALLSKPAQRWNAALSRKILDAYSKFDGEHRRAFFQALATEFGPEPSAARAAAKEYLSSGTTSALERLVQVMEPPRRELFRRLSMAPDATAALVSMRADLLALGGGCDAFEIVEADLRCLLGSWFDPASLTLERIDWHSPASILEKLICHDKVQPISSWNDLRRRLARDRRCYGLFHSALTGTPLVFAEIALGRGMASESRMLLDEVAPVLDPDGADTAVFYSINSAEPGLGGLGLGQFLITKVLSELQTELPSLETFATLSPLPRFADAMKAAAHNKLPGLTRAQLTTLLVDFAEPLKRASKVRHPIDALFALLDPLNDASREVLAGPLRRLALAYFGLISRGFAGADSEAKFHLSNGAELAQIHPFADMSPGRIEESFGVMVNYRYEPGELAVNQEKFLGSSEIAMSASLSRAFQKLRPIWMTKPAAA